MILRIAALLVLATAGLMLGRAAEPIVEQNRMVRNWPAVDATVSVRLANAPVPSATQHAETPPPRRSAGPPAAADLRVQYRHEVNGAIFRTTPSTPRAEEWLPPGRDVAAAAGESSYPRRGHYDPQRPDRLFFPKAFGFRDYWQVFLWGPMLALGFGGLVLRKPGRRRGAGPPVRADKGWHPLPPRYPLRQRASAAWGVAVVCNVILWAAAYDYFTGEPRARSAASDALVWLALLPGVATAWLAVYYSRTARRVGEPRVSVDTASLRAGMRLAVKVELPVRTKADLEHVVVSLACVRSALEVLRVVKRVIWEERVERSLGRRAQAGGNVAFEQRFTLPADAVPSAPGGISGARVEWEVRVEIPLDNGPDYRGAFPLTVNAAETPQLGHRAL